MKNGMLIAVTAGAMAVLPGVGRAETKIVLSDVHLCCGACVSAVKKIMKDVEGCTAVCSQDDGTITLTAEGDDQAKKALEALAEGGFHGDSDHEELKMEDDSGVEEGEIERLELEGVHNCCRACTTAIKEALKSVDGVMGDTVKARETSFVVEGKFDGKKLIEALYKAGFHVKLKKEKEEKDK